MLNTKEHYDVLKKLFKEKKRQVNVPVWFMRQAGRYLPEYQATMQHVTNFLDACYTPDLVEEITLQPIKRFDLDIAIVFSDIMVVLDALGFDVEFIRGLGPKIKKERVRKRTIEEGISYLSPIFKSIRNIRASLSPDKNLIGFAGAPWTMISYIYGSEKNFFSMRKEICTNSDVFNTLFNEITEFTIEYLSNQILSGADTVQLFDSNAYILPHELFTKYVISPTKKIVSSLKDRYPAVNIIGFPKGAGVMYAPYSTLTGVDATSVDYSVPVSAIEAHINGIIQGNLDPFLLAYDLPSALTHTKTLIQNLAEKPLIFNLGHGMLPETPVDNVKAIVDFVRSF